MDHVEYPAASKQDITFRFVAGNTAIKGGTLSFRIPNGWTTPIPVDADATVIKEGETGATIDADGTAGEGAAVPIVTEKISTGRTVTITVDALPQGGIIDVLYSNAIVQDSADTVDIIGEFKTTSSARSRRAGRVEVEVTNVADGSGSATMSTGSSPAYTARAGSTENSVTIVYKAVGTMSGGQVAFEIPDGWGDMQDDDADDLNHVAIRAGSGGTLDASTPSYVGRDVVVANLEDFEGGDTVTFTYTNAEAPGDLGIGAFVVSSAGSADGQLLVLTGEKARPANKEDADLLGEIYYDDVNDNKKPDRSR